MFSVNFSSLTLLSSMSNLLFNSMCYAFNDHIWLSSSCHIKLFYFISAQIFQFHNFLFSKDVLLSVISLIIQNIHILNFWNIYINSWFCWWSFLALDFGIHQRVLNERTAFGRRMVISILASFQKRVNFYPSLWLQAGECGSGCSSHMEPTWSHS